ncbi:MAG: UTP--glucose-1-phosphate uridylyltransferase, partial [Solirubrobacteraceae bacterium]
MSAEQVEAAVAKMREAGQSEASIRQFSFAMERVLSGAETMIPSSELEPAPDVPLLESLPSVDAASVLERLAVVKLNGGLATSMGLQQPKSLLEARDGRSFLEIVVGQTLALRRRYGARLPLILMN